MLLIRLRAPNTHTPIHTPLIEVLPLSIHLKTYTRHRLSNDCICLFAQHRSSLQQTTSNCVDLACECARADLFIFVCLLCSGSGSGSGSVSCLCSGRLNFFRCANELWNCWSLVWVNDLSAHPHIRNFVCMYYMCCLKGLKCRRVCKRIFQVYKENWFIDKTKASETESLKAK